MLKHRNRRFLVIILTLRPIQQLHLPYPFKLLSSSLRYRKLSWLLTHLGGLVPRLRMLSSSMLPTRQMDRGILPITQLRIVFNRQMWQSVL